jgi:hypothetical protein
LDRISGANSPGNRFSTAELSLLLEGAEGEPIAFQELQGLNRKLHQIVDEGRALS